MTTLAAIALAACLWAAFEHYARRLTIRERDEAQADADAQATAATAEKREHRKTATALVTARQELAARDAVARQCCAVCRELRVPTHVDIRPN